MSERIGALRSRWIDVDGRPIHARVSAQPAAPGSLIVVLIHGMGVSSRYLVPTAQRLAPDYDVAAPDLPGFGLSGHPAQVLDVPGLADALAAWMRAARIARAALLGNSFGCQIIADLAARYPELVERVVLQGPTIPPDLRDIMPPLSQNLDPIDPYCMGRWDQEPSTDDLLARRRSVHRLAPFRGCSELPQPLSFPPIGPDDPQVARRNLPRANPATQRPVPQFVR